SDLLTQVHRPPHTAKRGLSFLPPARNRASLSVRTSRVVPILGPFVTVLVAVVAARSVCAWWVAHPKRLAAGTNSRAETEAARIVKDAERDAETRRKESLLEAKEKAHELLMETERQARQERQQAAALEQTLTRREATVTDRQTAIERLEKELGAREKARQDRETSAA